MASEHRRRRWPWVLLALALLGGLRWTYWTVREHRWTTITPGKVYQSGVLAESVLRDKLTENGIKTVIDLREPDNGDLPAERAVVESMGLRYVNLPTGQVPKQATVDAFLEEMKEDPYPVLIHCKDGFGRSVLFTSIYRIEFEGWEPEQAWSKTRLFPQFGGFAPDTGKGRFLLGYQPERAGHADAPTHPGVPAHADESASIPSVPE